MNLQIGQEIFYAGQVSGEGCIVGISGDCIDVALTDGRMISGFPIAAAKPEDERQGCRHRVIYTEKMYPLEWVDSIKRFALDTEARKEAEREVEEKAFIEAVAKVKADNPDLSPDFTVNKNIRIMLKKEFPGVKFSVSDPRSPRIKWDDGPTSNQVERIVFRLKAGSFDSMCDMYRTSKSPWTEAFGSVDYIFPSRGHSEPFIRAVISRLTSEYPNATAPTFEQYKSGESLRMTPIGNAEGESYWSWQEIIRREMSEMTWDTLNAPSADSSGQSLACEPGL